MVVVEPGLTYAGNGTITKINFILSYTFTSWHKVTLPVLSCVIVVKAEIFAGAPSALKSIKSFSEAT
jgi:hypothetical protein